MSINFTRSLLAATAAAGVFAMVAATSASAAPSGYNWTGFYAGARAGMVAGDSDWSNIVVPSNTAENLAGTFATDKPNGAIVGLQGGYNFQQDQLVFGVEGDLNIASASASTLCIGNPSYGDFSAKCKTQVNWTGDLSARVGFTPVDRVLVYGKAGVAYVDSKFGPTDEKGFAPTTGYNMTSSNRWGYVLGVGADVAVTDRWSVGAEYNYQDFGSKNVAFTPAGAVNAYNPPFFADTTLKLNSLVVKMNYRF